MLRRSSIFLFAELDILLYEEPAQRNQLHGSEGSRLFTYRTIYRSNILERGAGAAN